MTPRQPVYLDYNATTPTDPRVLAALLPFLQDDFGNPGSAHPYGRTARDAVAAARTSVAALIGAPSDAVVFCGSGSEGDHLAIRGAALRRQPAGGHVITQASEHPAVLDACSVLQERHGYTITVLPVDRHGRVEPAQLAEAVTPRTALVSIMHANNETGTIQPVAELAAIAHRAGALFHTDAAQSAGKLPVDVAALDVDLLTLVGHKLYAPKGVAALFIRPGVDVVSLVGGGGQEQGRRAGTENVAYIVALGRACELAAELLAEYGPRVAGLRDRLHTRLEAALPGRVSLNGHPTQRLPNTLNVSIAGTDGDALLAAAPAVAASTGSACHAELVEPSPVLRAMGLSLERARAALRLSLGRETDGHDVTTAADALAAAAMVSRADPAPAWTG